MARRTLIAGAALAALGLAACDNNGHAGAGANGICKPFTSAHLDARVGKESLALSGIPTGYVDLDNITAGLQNSELVIVAARPSVGKTAFALNLTRHVILEEKLPVLFVSLEMARVELAERLLACEARVDSHKIRKGHLGSDDIQKLMTNVAVTVEPAGGSSQPTTKPIVVLPTA